MKIAAFKLTVLRMVTEILNRICHIYLGTVLAAILNEMEHHIPEKSQLAGPWGR